METKQKIDYETGIVLSGGGALGIAHVGYLLELEKRGIVPDCIAGTSMGAIIGGLRAVGYSPKAIEEIILGVDKKLIRKLIDLSLIGGIFKTRDIYKYFYSLVGDVLIENLKIPFVAVTVDITKGSLLYITKGRLVDAMIASMSIPIVFEGFKTDNGVLVDGGLRENFPVDAMKRVLNPNKIYGSVVLHSNNFEWNEREYEIPRRKTKFTLRDWLKSTFRKYKSLIEQASMSLNTILDESSKKTIDKNPEIHVTIIPPVTESTEFDKGKEIIDNGIKCTAERFK